jgi:hypothetical protein
MVAVVHEHVHQWASEQHQPRQRAEHVSTVLGPQEPAGHGCQYHATEAEA